MICISYVFGEDVVRSRTATFSGSGTIFIDFYRIFYCLLVTYSGFPVF